ncbi:MAG: hypothetical protein LUD02_00095 [Tannerellaceae bacterium]|nr:hypothetical protein [Tannerellaceae bacterium]MCD8262740.1 hypothetical protein [Tannerellaceae bacterium]
MRLFSNIISTVFHPLLMATYGIIMALSFTYLAIFPTNVKFLLAGGAFISTAVLPGLFILLMIKSGAASDLELSNRCERVVPYLIIITSLVSCIFFMYKMRLPSWLISVIIGACLALLIALCINFFWKISAHSIGIGGLLSAVMGISRIHMINPYIGFMILIMIAGLVGTVRVYLKRHTPMQVYAGTMLGFVCAFIASIWSFIYLFI